MSWLIQSQLEIFILLPEPQDTRKPKKKCVYELSSHRNTFRNGRSYGVIYMSVFRMPNAYEEPNGDVIS